MRRCNYVERIKNAVEKVEVGGGVVFFFFFQAEDGIRDWSVTGVQTCALPISNFRTGFALDCLYWFITPLVSQVLSMGAIICVMFPVYYLIGRSTEWDVVMHGFGPVAEMPLWAQGLIAIVIGDFIGYWTHRLFHCSKLWDIHAVHHGSTDQIGRASCRERV